MLAVLDIYQEYQFEVFEHLRASQSDFQIGYATFGNKDNFHGDSLQFGKFKDRLLEVTKNHDSVDELFFPEKINKLINIKYTLNSDLILQLKSAESYFLRISDRFATGPISVHDRRQYYLLLVNYFHHQILEQKISTLIVFDTPHSPSSNLFYELCKYLGIHVIRMEYHFLPSFSLLIDGYSFPELPANYLQELSEPELRQRIPAPIQQNFSGVNKFLESYKSRETKALISSSNFSSVRLYIRYLNKYIKNTIRGIFPFFFKQQVRHFTAFNNVSSEFQHRKILNKAIKEIINLNNYYNSICESPDVNRKYIFYGMHMQPEKTSQPMGGEFDHQLLPIIILAQSLPEGWVLYVKDHPNQFNIHNVTTKNYRSKSFYDSVLNLKNVKFVPLDFPSEELVAGAQINSTLTGTLGWESLKMGVPVIVFGDAYYQACASVIRADSVDSCVQAIADLTKRTKQNIENDILKYLIYYYEQGHLIKASNWESVFKLSEEPRSEQITAIAQRIEKLLTKTKAIS